MNDRDYGIRELSSAAAFLRKSKAAPAGMGPKAAAPVIEALHELATKWAHDLPVATAVSGRSRSW